MVCEWGMSEEMGPITFGEKHEEIFLGREIAQHRDYSERTAQIIDQEVKKIVIEAADEVEHLLRENIKNLHALSNALLEHEILDGSEVDRILAGEKLNTSKTKKVPVSSKVKQKRGRKKAVNIVSTPALAPAI